MRLVPCLLLSFMAACLVAADAPNARHLIEFGWDEPDTAYLRSHAEAMAKSPFDGTVFHANIVSKDGKTENLAWIAWGRRAIQDDEVKAAMADLSAWQPGRFRQNFLRFNTTPADLDWFDDHSSVLSNARLAARLAKAGRCRGILLDTEAYERPLFHYRKQRDAKTRDFDAYAAQARLGGRELMRAFRAEFPDLVVLLTFGPSLPLRESKGGTIPPWELENGLLAPFVRGLIDEAKEGAKVVDGFEPSYGFTSRAQFEAGLRDIRREPGISAAFGLWLDYDWRKNGWNLTDPARNHFSPEKLESSLRTALELTDEFVWIYAETPRWWTADGTPIKLPAAYDEAMRRSMSAK